MRPNREPEKAATSLSPPARVAKVMRLSRESAVGGPSPDQAYSSTRLDVNLDLDVDLDADVDDDHATQTSMSTSASVITSLREEASSCLPL